MVFKYDVEKIKNLIWHFHNVTGISISIRDSEFNHIATCPENLIEFCRIIQASDEGHRRCQTSDSTLFASCLECRQSLTHTCHAGLADTVVPIYNNGVLLGFIIFGQVGSKSKKKPSFASIYKKVSDLGIDKEKLRIAYDEVGFFKEDKILSAAEIVAMLTKYIMIDQIIQPYYDSGIETIIKYIDNHLTDDLSVPVICNTFNISKNSLYKMFATHLGCGVNEYISLRRISRAEQLLKTTNIPIYQICERCGIDNYQYFCRLFKKEKGITPLHYRKRWESGKETKKPQEGENENV
ncbi:MAG: helix-turn-helix domain-containing protein [Ruminococcaceae bacterium]|nr:helix-turn-helix domain-containing protein [Oscillospiraceae bacterium]